ncbi:hypothetical protein DFH09DRAFT_1338812 [Mycena vulgaris]|nr:hypothetical protein DFH09DRAFT_1338812 [Mycena vulgaris]
MYAAIPLEIEEAFISSLDLRDLVNYSHTGKQGRIAVQYILQRRSTTLLLSYLSSSDIATFWSSLTAGKGGLTGSGPVWITQPLPTWTPANLNAVVAAGAGHDTRLLLRKIGWTQAVSQSRIPVVLPSRTTTPFIDSHPRACVLTDKTWVFTKAGHLPITVTETADRSVFRHLAGAKHSMATTLLTETALISLHPKEAVLRDCAWRHGSGLPTHERTYAAGRVAAMGGSNNHCILLRGPSHGQQCLALLRRLRGGQGTGLLSWKSGTQDSVAMDAYSGFMQDFYSIGWSWSECKNPDCEMFGFPRDVACTLPMSRTSGGNYKEKKIALLSHSIENGYPPFTRVYRGVLFPTSCRVPKIVPVPLDHGVVAYHTMDDLRAYTWIDPIIKGFPLYPQFMKPHETIGSTTIFNPLAWREPLSSRAQSHLLIFMACIHELGPLNITLLEPGAPPRPVHGDVLLMIETNGSIQDTRQEDIPRLREAFARVWASKSKGDRIGTSYSSSF